MTNKNQAIEVPVNSALQANITPIGIDFEMNRLRLGENYCCIFAITDYPSECDYGWYSRLTNIPGVTVSRIPQAFSAVRYAFLPISRKRAISRSHRPIRR